jgi:hypothetical protein
MSVKNVNSPYLLTLPHIICNAQTIRLIWSSHHNIKEAKDVPLHATKALGGRGGTAATHSRLWHQMGVSGQRHAPAAL